MRSKMEDIKKGIENDFVRNDEMKFAKKGSEIKEALNTVISTAISGKNSTSTELEKLLKEIPCSPDADNNKWKLEGYEHLLGIIPKSFSYDKIYGRDGLKESNYSAVENITPDKEQQNKMRKYNDLVCKWIDLSISILNLQSLSRNLEDKKNYLLTIDQLTKLGL